MCFDQLSAIYVSIYGVLMSVRSVCVLTKSATYASKSTFCVSYEFLLIDLVKKS